MKKRWVPIDDQCGECGNDAEVFTDAEQDGYVCDGDEVRCIGPGCGERGSVSCDAESEPWVNWEANQI